MTAIALPTERHRVIKSRAGEGGLALERQPVAAPGAGEVLVQVRQAAICGTDLHLYQWNDWAARNYRPPLPLGHEFAGVVLAVGEGVHHIRPGCHVAGETHLSCGHCRQCRANRRHTCENLRLFSKLGVGCFADYLTVPEQVLRPLHPELPFAKAAVMEPFGVGVRAAMEADLRGKNLLMSGCGPIGLYTIAAARHLGAASIVAIDPSPFRRALAMKIGATVALEPSAGALRDSVHEALRGDGVEVAIDASGRAGAVEQALDCVAAGGSVVLVGVPERPLQIDAGRHLINRELRLQGTYGRLIDETWLVAERLMLSGQVDVEPILTHTLPLEGYQEAFALALGGAAGKVAFELPA